MRGMEFAGQFPLRIPAWPQIQTVRLDTRNRNSEIELNAIVTRMKPRSVSKKAVSLNKLALPVPMDGQKLKVALLYQDSATRKWARETSERVAKIAGPENIHATWWNISELCEPGVLAAAVSTAMRADVIVIARDAAQRLSYPFYVWVESWLPHRQQATGTLVALIGSSAPAKAHSEQASEYLRAMARAGHLEFLLEERNLPAQQQKPDESDHGLDLRAIRQILRIEVPSLAGFPNN